MWLIAKYEAVTLFSLKLSSATSSGGKTLLLPTPYAIKMALLDTACRTLGVVQAENLWPKLRGLRIALYPAEAVVVTNLFQRVLRPRRKPAEAGDPDTGPFQKTIGYREYAHWHGALGMAFSWDKVNEASPAQSTTPRAKSRKKQTKADAPMMSIPDPVTWLPNLLLNVNYLGKRGGFVQLLTPPNVEADLPSEFVEVTQGMEETGRFMINGVLQVLDDCNPELTFSQVNIYSGEKLKSSDRVLRQIVIPYQLKRSSKSFSWYERVE